MSERHSFRSAPAGGSLSSGSFLARRNIPCKFFNTSGGCFRGEGCAYDHPLPQKDLPRHIPHKPSFLPSTQAHFIPLPKYGLDVDFKALSKKKCRVSLTSRAVQLPRQTLSNPTLSKNKPEFRLDAYREDEGLKTLIAAQIANIQYEQPDETAIHHPVMEVEDWTELLDDEDAISKIEYPTELRVSRCTGFELFSASVHSVKICKLPLEIGSPEKICLNSFRALGPESCLKIEEFSDGFARMLPSIQNGWNQFRGLRGKMYAGCSRTSQISEALSYELLNRFNGASLLFTEMDIEYKVSEGVPKIDYVVLLGELRIGVSVTRAVNLLSKDGNISTSNARILLEKKLAGLDRSSEFVTEQFAWTQNMLHVWSPSYAVTKRLLHCCRHLLVESRTLVMITTTSFLCPPAFSYIYGKE